jgi:hypothetical protein
VSGEETQGQRDKETTTNTNRERDRQRQVDKYISGTGKETHQTKEKHRQAVKSEERQS